MQAILLWLIPGVLACWWSYAWKGHSDNWALRNLSTGIEASATGESLNSGDVAVHPAARQVLYTGNIKSCSFQKQYSEGFATRKCVYAQKWHSLCYQLSTGGVTVLCFLVSGYLPLITARVARAVSITPLFKIYHLVTTLTYKDNQYSGHQYIMRFLSYHTLGNECPSRPHSGRAWSSW